MQSLNASSRRARPVRGLTVIGDSILDRDLNGSVERVCPDAPAPVVDLTGWQQRPGGAALAASLLAAEGYPVRLVTVLGADPGGDAVRTLLPGQVELVEAARGERTRTVTRVRSAGHALVRLDENPDRLPGQAALDEAAVERAVAASDVVLISDYGRGLAAHPAVRRILRHWSARRPMVWDPHPHGPQPVPGVALATPNRAEAAVFADQLGAAAPGGALDRLASLLRQAWRARAVAATDGTAGVFTALEDSPPLFVPAPFAHTGDSCGAGDRFVAAVVAALAGGAVITEAVESAVGTVAHWLAAGGVATVGAWYGLQPWLGPPPGHRLPAATPGGDPLPAAAPNGEPIPAAALGTGAAGAQHPPDGWRLAASVRARGGTVVATGGCFDLLHAGHVACLQAARRLGDCLVVLLNSDAAVSRLKGPGRPVQPVQDRAEVLQSMSCVDAVIVFDEDSPAAALSRLRPDIWAKGGDYAGATLPESAAVRHGGGRTVLLPYLPGRSTTAILGRSAPDPTPGTTNWRQLR